MWVDMLCREGRGGCRPVEWGGGEGQVESSGMGRLGYAVGSDGISLYNLRTGEEVCSLLDVKGRRRSAVEAD